MCDFECSFLLSLRYLLLHGYSEKNTLKKYHSDIQKCFFDLSLSQTWINLINNFIRSLGMQATVINDPINYRFDIQLIRGPATYFEITDKKYIKVLTVTSGYPYTQLQTVAMMAPIKTINLNN